MASGPTKKTAIARHELEAMLVTYDDSLGGLRDRALLCFGLASGGRRRRRSEIAADLCDLRKVGEDGYIYRLKYSKTQQVGAKADSTPDKPILGRSAEALTAGLEAAAIREGAIFRWIGRIGPAPLPGSVATIVKRRTALAGLEGDFGAHSLRFGLVAEAGKQGVPFLERHGSCRARRPITQGRRTSFRGIIVRIELPCLPIHNRLSAGPRPRRPVS